MKRAILLTIIPKLAGIIMLSLSLNLSAQEHIYKTRFNPFIATNENGKIFDSLKTKAQRDSLVQVYINEDWADGWHIPYYPGPPEWNCQDASRQLWINFFGDTLEIFCNGYSGFILDSIYANSGTLYDNGKYGLPVLQVIVGYENQSSGHMMNAILTGDSVLEWSDWSFIEPQRDQTNLQPGDAYMPGIHDGYIKDTVDGGLSVLYPIYYTNGGFSPNGIAVSFNITDGVPSPPFFFNDEHLFVIKERDTLQPKIQVTNPINGQFYNIDPDLNYSLEDSTLKYAWYSIDGGVTKVDLYKDWYELRYVEGIGYIFVAVYNTNGTVAINLNDGNYEFITYAIDHFNLETSDTICFTVDKTPPILNISSPIQGSTYRQNDVAFDYKISEKNPDFANSYYQFNGIRTYLSDTIGTVSITSNEGLNTLEIHFQDLATNITSKTITYTLDTQSGVDDLQNTPEVIFYPNPVKNIGVFTVENEDQEPLIIELYDVSGRLLSNSTYQSDVIKIDFSQFSSGTITYKIRNSQRTLRVGTIIKE